jgi:hypothetical protein
MDFLKNFFNPNKAKTRSNKKHIFTLWVKDENPNETYLLALLFRIRHEHPENVSKEIRDMLDNKIPHDLQYKFTRNHMEGKTYVDFIFTPR